jgi:hypothetical protein
MKNDEIKNRLREYFDKLFNYESEKTAIELDDSVDTVCDGLVISNKCLLKH